MNIFNKIVVVILLIVVVVFSLVAIVNIFTGLFRWTDVADRIGNYFSSINLYILAGILFLVFVVGIVLLVFEFYRKKISSASISSDQSGKAMVTVKTIANQIKDSLAGEKDLDNLKVKVIPKSDGIIINMFAKLSQEVNIPDKMKELREKVSEFASRKLGFKVIQTNLTAVGFIPKKEEKPEEERKVEVEEETKEEEDYKTAKGGEEKEDERN